MSHRRALALLLLGLVSPAPGALHSAWPPAATAGAVRWWTAHATVKVRPDDPAPAHRAPSVELHAARNEFESFQVVLNAGAEAVENVDLELSDFSGPKGAVLSRNNVTLYLVRYLQIRQSSSPVEATSGEWPDALAPKVDRYRKSVRNAFPFHLKRGRNQPLWVEVYVPPATPPGRYTAQARVTGGGHAERTPGGHTERNAPVGGGATAITFPVNLNVWNFTLPSTSSLRTSYGFNGVTALKKHRGAYTSDEDLVEISQIYARAALLHRVSTHGGSMSPPPFAPNGGGGNPERNAAGGGVVRIDWRMYDREVGPFLDGTVLGPNDPLPGAKVTSVDLRTHGSADTDEKKVAYWKEWVRHFREKGWGDRLYNYVWDEPPASVYPKVAAKARLARQADPALKNLVTASLDPALAGVIDIWTPLINCLESKPGFPDFCEKTVPFEAYKSEIRTGKSLWFYQSCASHGCTGGAKGDYFKGWPSYMVDAPAIANRVMGWLAWKYKVQGELYFAMNEAYGREGDPWDDLFMHSGNGDGTFFYPGRPEEIGGSGHIPIESIRLKLVREGLEDYEYLALLARSGLADFAERSAARIVQTTYLWERQPNNLYLVRQEIGERLNAVSGAGARTKPN